MAACGGVEVTLERDAAALRFVRDIVENAPGIAYLTLSCDMRGLVLYANWATLKVLGTAPSAPRPRTAWLRTPRTAPGQPHGVSRCLR